MSALEEPAVAGPGETPRRRLWPPERSDYCDSATGARVIEWTKGPHKNQHLYFTSPSVTTDDRWLVFLSDRTGSPNLFAIDRRDGAIRQLSDNREGLLRSYVYPRGGERGLSKASPCLDAVRNLLYYVRDDRVYGASLDVEEEWEICRLPAGWVGGFSHISPDGCTLCLPVADPRAFMDRAESQWEQMRLVAPRMEREKLGTRIYLVNVVAGAAALAAEVPFWVTHVQFDPSGTGRIIFNREGFAAGGDHPPHHRIWCLEPDGSFRPLAPEPPGEWRSHENWAADGRSIVYHGGRGGTPFLAARTWEGELIQETQLDGLGFWHATGAADGRRLIVDRPNGFISIVDPGAAGPDQVRDLCRHDSVVEDQDAHPHPIATARGRSVVFTSVRAGNGNVYEVLLDEET